MIQGLHSGDCIKFRCAFLMRHGVLYRSPYIPRVSALGSVRYNWALFRYGGVAGYFQISRMGGVWKSLMTPRRLHPDAFFSNWGMFRSALGKLPFRTTPWIPYIVELPPSKYSKSIGALLRLRGILGVFPEPPPPHPTTTHYPAVTANFPKFPVWITTLTRREKWIPFRGSKYRFSLGAEAEQRADSVADRKFLARMPFRGARVTTG